MFQYLSINFPPDGGAQCVVSLLLSVELVTMVDLPPIFELEVATSMFWYIDIILLFRKNISNFTKSVLSFNKK